MSKKKANKNTREQRNKREHKKIESEKRNAFSNFLIRLILIILLTVCCILIYARYTSTSGFEIHEYKITSNKIPDSFQGFKIIHISDLRYGSTINKQSLDNIKNKINETKPDLIVFTGDLIYNESNITEEDKKIISDFLYNIDSSAGKYAVVGDQDTEDSEMILTSGEFTILRNESDRIYYKDYIPIIISGSGSSLKKEDDFVKTFSYQNDETNNLYQITMIHESDSALDIADNYNTDLILTGNSLGGLIRLPGIGNIYSIDGSRKNNKTYIEKNNTKIYNSFGLGTTNIKFRYFNRPSANLYKLFKE